MKQALTFWLLALVGAAIASAGGPASAELLTATEEHLVARRYSEAKASAIEALRALKTQPTEPARAEVGRAFLLTSLVAAARGDHDGAGLAFTAALAFDATLDQLDLARFGPAGESARADLAAALEVGRRAIVPEKGSSAVPKLQSDIKPEFPFPWRKCSSVRITVHSWWDEAGRPRGIGGAESNCGTRFLIEAIRVVTLRKYRAGTDPETGGPVPFRMTLTLNATSNRLPHP